MKDFGNIIKVMNQLMDAHSKLYEERKEIIGELKSMQKVMFNFKSNESTSFVNKVVHNRYIKLTIEVYSINMDMYRIMYKYGEIKKYLKGY